MFSMGLNSPIREDMPAATISAAAFIFASTSVLFFDNSISDFDSIVNRYLPGWVFFILLLFSVDFSIMAG